MSKNHFPPIQLSPRELNRYYANFIEELKDKRPETRGTYERALREFLRWFPGERKFYFQIEDVECYKHYLTNTKRLSEVSVSTYLTALRQFCQYLMRINVLSGNPAKEVGGNKRPMTHSREILKHKDLYKLFQSIDRTDERGLRDYAIIKAMLGCGLSEIEIVRADVGDIQHLNGQAMMYVQGKGHDTKDEIVPLPTDVKEAFDAYLAHRKEVQENDPLFISAGNRTRGSRMTTRAIRERVNHYLEAAGIKKGRARRLTPYSLRHTAAVLMVENGASAEEVKERMRLGSLATAMIYMKQKGKLGAKSFHKRQIKVA